jgi:hypothetical protein
VGERGGEDGPRWLRGPEEEVGRRGRGEKEREESCWAGPRGEGERFRGLVSFVFFFQKLFKSFQTFKTF